MFRHTGTIYDERILFCSTFSHRDRTFACRSVSISCVSFLPRLVQKTTYNKDKVPCANSIPAQVTVFANQVHDRTSSVIHGSQVINQAIHMQPNYAEAIITAGISTTAK